MHYLQCACVAEDARTAVNAASLPASDSKTRVLAARQELMCTSTRPQALTHTVCTVSVRVLERSASASAQSPRASPTRNLSVAASQVSWCRSSGLSGLGSSASARLMQRLNSSLSLRGRTRCVRARRVGARTCVHARAGRTGKHARGACEPDGSVV